PLASETAGTPSWVRSLLVAPMDYGVLCLSFILLGYVPLFIAVYTFLFVASTVFLLLAAVKWFRELVSVAGDSPSRGSTQDRLRRRHRSRPGRGARHPTASLVVVDDRRGGGGTGRHRNPRGARSRRSASATRRGRRWRPVSDRGRKPRSRRGRSTGRW